MRAETRIIVNSYYDKKDKDIFTKFAKIIEKDYQYKETQI